MIKKLFFFVFAFGLISCNQEKESKANTDLLYFDIKGYFQKEALRLNKSKPKILKVVTINGLSENKNLNIKDWEKEFSIFANADINKASWKGSFKTQKAVDKIIYTSSNKKIPVKKVQIDFLNKSVAKIKIIISNKNILYTSGDTLLYYPDSLYLVKKYQKIKLLKEKKYQVKELF
ncbi:hypothetical protein QWY86_15080 [Pedobacter aquatilis]|uniref:hypothetical protein n=1 Tax=Pedobacter aquatilis TaxID=351343 RepID=UPI0025B4DF95|nr:hypothetical protein [Pedobacter aquatilis]MDN3588004.1 hypothetical protein [Pedobacter aquatilis]